jgi:UDP-glucose 4-epimerase
VNVLVTGGAGFIGSHTTARLLAEGHQVTVLDNLSLGRPEFVALFDSQKKDGRYRFVEGDLISPATVANVLKDIELVIHLAANSDISSGASKNHLDFENGTLATYQLLEGMRKMSVKKLIFASSSAIYGEAKTKPTPESYGPLFPISFYGASKLACEAMCTAFAHNCEMRVWIYRFANVVGSHATHGAIFDFIGRLMDDPSQLRVLGDGSQRKSYLHVSDCVDGMLSGFRLAKGHPLRSEVDCLNLASQGTTTVRFIAEEVVRQMWGISGIEAKLLFGTESRGWVGDVAHTHLDGSAFGQLGWQARLASDEAVTRAIEEIISERKV